MLNEAARARFYRFGEYEVDSARRLLLRNGERVTLTPKAFHVLLSLLERHGEVVSKDELLRIVWPDTVVEEISLTRNISVLRKTLGEKPDEHNYIVTVPGTGYRFVAAVERADGPGGDVSENARSGRRWLLMAVMALSAVAGLVAWYFQSESGPPLRRAVPLTSFRGFERNPAISPDGSQVAFTWDGQNQNNFDIYVKTVRAADPVRLTTNSAEDVSPAWSPDGHTIAFVRRVGGNRGDLLSIPASGGPERKLAETRGEFRFDLPSFAWSPDGRWLAVSHREPADLANALFLVSMETGQTRRMTTAPQGYVGDYMPAFSPDGRSLAFVRMSGWVAGEIHILTLAAGYSAVAEPKRLTSDGRLATSPVWTHDARDILYVLAESNRRELRSIPASGARNSRRISLLEDHVNELSLRGPLLAYSRETADSNIWRAEIGRTAIPLSAPRRLIASTRHDEFPRYSPDGKKIGFVSARSGTREIWIAEADGSNPLPLTSFGGPSFGPPAWSPDSQRIVFHTRSEGQGDLFIVPAIGGAPQRLTTDPSDDLTPGLSHDGRWIYFSSMRSGRWELWKMPAEGGGATQITSSEGSYLPTASPDGKTLYYCHKVPEKGIWRIPAQGGEAVQVTGSYSPPLCAMTVTAQGLYYTAAPDSSNKYSIQFISFSTGQSRPVVVSERPFIYLALSVSPDGRWLLYSQSESDSDLMLVENFTLR
jgi:Tol biopolymer transport system component/DNA-binding winged helix-turn-helix (wHTH) protein